MGRKVSKIWTENYIIKLWEEGAYEFDYELIEFTGITSGSDRITILCKRCNKIYKTKCYRFFKERRNCTCRSGRLLWNKEYIMREWTKQNKHLIYELINCPEACNGKARLTVKCLTCENTFEIEVKSLFLKGKICRKCNTREQRLLNGTPHPKTKFNEQIVSDFFNKDENKQYVWMNRGQILDGNKSRIIFKCLKCKNLTNIDLNNLLRFSPNCSVCGRCTQFSEEKILFLFETIKNKDEYEIILETIKNITGHKQKFVVKHLKCQNFVTVSGNEFYDKILPCPFCRSSKGEREIRRVLENRQIAFQEQFKINECKRIFHLPFDFFIPSFNLLIEYNGEQHYRPVERFGGDTAYQNQVKTDLFKKECAENAGYSFLTIPYWDFKNIEEIIDNFISFVGTLN